MAGREQRRDGARWPELARAVSHARKATGMRQTELARRVSLSHGFIGMIEAGRRRPEVEKLRRIAEVLSVPYEQLAVPARYMDREDPTELPPDIVEVVRRMVARGIRCDAFEALEAFAARMLYSRDDGADQRSQADLRSAPRRSVDQLQHRPESGVTARTGP